jgi:hypothetical protein
MKEFKYKGYWCSEAEEFFKGFVTREERDGCGVVGHFINLSNGKTCLPNKGDVFIKEECLTIRLKLKNEKL